MSSGEAVPLPVMTTVRAHTGAIVVYTLTKTDSDAINKRRESGPTSAWALTIPGDDYPAIVLDADEFMIDQGAQLHVFLDGAEGLWIHRARRGKKPGEWRWPPSQQVLDLVALAADAR